MTLRYGLGHIKDRPELRYQKPALQHTLIAARYAALKASPSGGISLRPFEAPIYDQGQSGSCGGNGSAQLIFTALNAAGMPLPWAPSPKRIYQNTRAVRRAADATGGALPPLTDSGVMPADLATALGRYGVSAKNPATSPDGRNCDVWTAADTGGADNVNDEPDAEDLEAEAFTLVTGEYRIDETASDLGAQMAAAIEAKMPVGVGAFVDSGVMAWSAGDPPINSIDTSGANGGGGHWYAVTGYTLVGSVYVFDVANSWGVAYGDAGHFLITEAALKQSASDIYPWAIDPWAIARVAKHVNARKPVLQ